jgi:predicted CXXCH cytochrome family protein
MECLECHEPHMPKMSHVDCLKCHPPHLPQKIKDTPRQAGAVCVSCHQEPAGRLKEQGAAHKKLPCISCHRSHPPHGKHNIATCDVCHDEDDNRHFAVKQCQGCHRGHQPLEDDLSKAENVSAACNACHAEVVETFAKSPSKHAEQACNSCHLQHKQAQKCSDCHEPHGPEMTEADCLSCHKAPHAPAQVVFAGTLPSGFCQSCHAAQVDSLTTSPAGHNTLACVDCHQGNHGSSLDCSSCHEQPHDPGLHSKYPDCLKCHNDPHDLADWQGGEETAVVAPATQADEPDGISAVPGAVTSEDVK